MGNSGGRSMFRTDLQELSKSMGDKTEQMEFQVAAGPPGALCKYFGKCVPLGL